MMTDDASRRAAGAIPANRSGPRAGRRAAAALLLAFACFQAGCTLNLNKLEEPPEAAAVTTGGPWSSMIYAARTERGVIVIDLGWDRSGARLAEALERLDATREDVVAVFLTHAHRDHIAAWREVRHARFHLAEAELPRLVGKDEHEGMVPRLVDRLIPPDLPAPGDLEIVAFGGDTAFAFGADTVRAFMVPGHTPGSTVYLFRDVLFLGDAVAHTPVLGFQGPRAVHTDDQELSRASLDSMWPRVLRHGPRLACTAHGRCSTVDREFIAAVSPWPPRPRN